MTKPAYHEAVFVVDKLADDILARHKGDRMAILLEASEAWLHLRKRIIDALYISEKQESNLIQREGKNAEPRLVFNTQTRYRDQVLGNLK